MFCLVLDKECLPLKTVRVIQRISFPYEIYCSFIDNRDLSADICVGRRCYIKDAHDGDDVFLTDIHETKMNQEDGMAAYEYHCVLRHPFSCLTDRFSSRVFSDIQLFEAIQIIANPFKCFFEQKEYFSEELNSPLIQFEKESSMQLIKYMQQYYAFQYFVNPLNEEVEFFKTLSERGSHDVRRISIVDITYGHDRVIVKTTANGWYLGERVAINNERSSTVEYFIVAIDINQENGIYSHILVLIPKEVNNFELGYSSVPLIVDATTLGSEHRPALNSAGSYSVAYNAFDYVGNKKNILPHLMSFGPSYLHPKVGMHFPHQAGVDSRVGFIDNDRLQPFILSFLPSTSNPSLLSNSFQYVASFKLDHGHMKWSESCDYATLSLVEGSSHLKSEKTTKEIKWALETEESIGLLAKDAISYLTNSAYQKIASRHIIIDGFGYCQKSTFLSIEYRVSASLQAQVHSNIFFDSTNFSAFSNHLLCAANKDYGMHSNSGFIQFQYSGNLRVNAVSFYLRATHVICKSKQARIDLSQSSGLKLSSHKIHFNALDHIVLKGEILFD